MKEAARGKEKNRVPESTTEEDTVERVKSRWQGLHKKKLKVLMRIKKTSLLHTQTMRNQMWNKIRSELKS